MRHYTKLPKDARKIEPTRLAPGTTYCNICREPFPSAKKAVAHVKKAHGKDAKA